MKFRWYIPRDEWEERSIYRGKVLGAIFTFIGIVIFSIGYYQFFMSNKSRSWNTASGSIFYSKLVKGKNSDDEITYRPLIKYKYSVDGMIYRSDRIFYGNMFEQSSPKLSISYIERYPEKSDVIVYYHPYNPEKSVLIPGETGYAKQLMILSIVFIASGIIIMNYHFRKEKQMEMDKF
jgi:hypothetical protein